MLQKKIEYRVRKAQREGKIYVPLNAAERAQRAHAKAEHTARRRRRRELLRLLRSLLARRCEEVDITTGGLKWRLRYAKDQAFNRKERARRHTNVRLLRHAMTTGSLSLEESDAMLEAARVCAYCRRLLAARDRTLDHLVPLSRGGEHELGNVVVACRSCNARKHRRTPLEFVFGLRAPRPTAVEKKVLPSSLNRGCRADSVIVHIPLGGPIAISFRAPGRREA